MFHVNGAGNAGKCKAKPGNCPFGDEKAHYATAEEARTAFEAAMANAALTPVSKTATIDLSAEERDLLGTDRMNLNGTPSTINWPTADQWPAMRAMLVANSVKANPKLDPRFTAYTPGETLDLMNLPEVAAWHERARNYRVPEGKTIVFVPCAKTKPWDRESSGKSSYYSAYHKLMEARPDLHFVTISEPLGLVDMEDWGSFLQYDNPGLFHDPAQRSSLHRSAWLKAGYDGAKATPFSEKAYEQSIEKLSSVIGDFLSHHRSHKIISLVDGRDGERTTHGHMLDGALAQSGATVQRFAKRGAPRVSPLPYFEDLLAKHSI